MSKVNAAKNHMSQREKLLNRRTVAQSAAAAGVGVSLAGTKSVMAQTPAASPSASPVSGEVITNHITREEYMAQVRENFALEEPQNTGGQVIHQNSTDIATLNPVLSQDTYSSMICGFVFEPLIGMSIIDGRDVPSGLADGWEITPDGLEYTVFLNPDATWHDGTPFTSADVVATFDGALAENSQSVRKTTVEAVLASYEAVDEHTMKFYAHAPSGIFLTEALGQFEIVPAHIWADVDPGDWPSDGGATGTDPSRVIGTGPFKFREWKLGELVTLDRNENYWQTDAVPVIDSLMYQVVADAQTVLAGLQTGAADFAGVGFADADGLKESNPEVQVVAIDSTAMNYYYANQDPSKTEMFTDVKVRQALQYALDRELLAQEVYFGYAVKADGTQPVLSIAYDPENTNTIYNYDPEKASALLEEAGWVDSDGDGIREKDGETLSFELVYSEGTSTYPIQIPYMQDAWRAVGIEAVTTAIPFQVLIEEADAGNYDMGVAGFGWNFDGGQDSMFASWNTPPNGFNKMHYSNADYDALVEPSKTEIDPEKRIEILLEQSNILNDDAAAGILVFRQNIYGAGPNLHNFFPVGYSGYWWMNYAWVDPR